MEKKLSGWQKKQIEDRKQEASLLRQYRAETSEVGKSDDLPTIIKRRSQLEYDRDIKKINASIGDPDY